MAVPETVGPSASEHLGSSPNDGDILAGGGPMSPAANDLLPSNLFRDEDIIQESPTAMRHDLFNGGATEWNERQSNPSAENADTERRTPGSADSRRGSLLSSPHGSIRNVRSGQSSVDVFADNDHLSAIPLVLQG